MCATDVKPSRLDAAARCARSSKGAGHLRVGVVSFSDEPQVVVSPTIDRTMLAQGIDVLGPGFGTAIGDAPRAACRAVGDRGDRDRRQERQGAAGRARRSLASILLLSDGAQTRGLLSPGQGAERAQVAGIPVFTIALGTDEGTILAGPPGQEQVISVPPDRETLGAIASNGCRGLRRTERRRAREGLRGPRSRVGREEQPEEVTAVFVAAGALPGRRRRLALLSAPRLP